MVEMNERTLKLIRMWLLVVQVPLIVIMGFDGKEFSDWTKVFDPIPVELRDDIISIGLQVRYYGLLATVITTALNIPFAILVAVKMTRKTVKVAAAMGFLLFICAFTMMITGHLNHYLGPYLIPLPDERKAKSWFGMIFALSYSLPLLVLDKKLPPNYG